MKQAIDRESREVVALKIFKKKGMSVFSLNAAHDEYSIIKSLDHANIVQTRGFFEDTNFIIMVN